MSILGDLNRLNELQRDLVALSRVAVALLDQNNLEALDDVWTKRRRLFRELLALNRRLASCFQSWDQHQDPRSQQLVDQAAEQGETVLQLDRQIKKRLQQRKREVSEKLTHLKKGEKLVKAYRPIPCGPTLADKLSRIG
ncbi:MAG: hypothetical protein PVG03_05230 [Desulfarculaceae bacterium]